MIFDCPGRKKALIFKVPHLTPEFYVMDYSMQNDFTPYTLSQGIIYDKQFFNPTYEKLEFSN